MTKRVDDVKYIAFSVSKADERELRRLAKRLCYPNIEPLAVELFRVGMQCLEESFETPTVFGEMAQRRQRVHASECNQPKGISRRAGRAPDDPDRQRRRDRILRRHGMER